MFGICDLCETETETTFDAKIALYTCDFCKELTADLEPITED